MMTTLLHILSGRPTHDVRERREREMAAVRAELNQQVQGVQSGARVLQAVAENVELNQRRQ